MRNPRKRIALSIALGASLAQPGQAQRMRGVVMIADRGPEVTAALPGGVTLHGDIPIPSMPGFRPTTVDLYTPQSTGLHPAVVFIHGGGWNMNTARTIDLTGAQGTTVFAQLAARGAVVASLNYRLSGEAPFPAQIEDARSAVMWLKANAAKYNIDPARIVLWGGSAGAQVAMVTALDCRDNRAGAKAIPIRSGPPGPPGPEAAPAPAAPPGAACVAGVVDWFGPPDFVAHEPEAGAPVRKPPPGFKPPEVTYLGCSSGTCDTATLTRGSPISYVASNAPDFLIVHGDADSVIPFKQSVRLQEALRKAGNKATLHTVPNGDHLFGGASPQDIAIALEQTFDFILNIGK